MSTTSYLLSVIGCLLASAFMSGSETALTSIPRARARQLVEEDGHSSLRLWIEHPERVISTILIGNTAVNALLATLVTALLGRLGAHTIIAVATGITTLLLLIFGEITPKTLAQKYAVQLAPYIMGPIRALCFLARPLVEVFALVPRAIDRAVRGPDKPGDKRRSITREELEFLMDLGVREGVLDRDRSQMITGILQFSEIIAREIMVPRMRVVGIPATATKEQVLRVVNESEHSRIPVYDGSIDRVTGVLYVRAMLSDLVAHPAQPFDLRRYVRPPFFVPELMKISRLLREFQRRKTHLAVVVDEFGGTAGVVALEDVVEEIVGEIQDEQDVEEGRVRVLPDGSLVADASITLRDLEPHLGLDFPDEYDFDSLGGFVTAMAGKVPPVGSVVLWRGLRFTVRAGDERRVARVEIGRSESADARAARDKPPEKPGDRPAEAAARDGEDGRHG